MPYFCHQISYTTDAWNQLVRNPQTRFDPIRVPIENLGGTIHATFFTEGNYDLLVISEFPESVSASAIAVAFSIGGAVARIQTTPLLSTTQAIESWRKSNLLRPSSSDVDTHLAASAGH
jgi:uncharacterized protein with GYD domain